MNTRDTYNFIDRIKIVLLFYYFWFTLVNSDLFSVIFGIIVLFCGGSVETIVFFMKKKNYNIFGQIKILASVKCYFKKIEFANNSNIFLVKISTSPTLYYLYYNGKTYLCVALTIFCEWQHFEILVFQFLLMPIFKLLHTAHLQFL